MDNKFTPYTKALQENRFENCRPQLNQKCILDQAFRQVIFKLLGFGSETVILNIYFKFDKAGQNWAKLGKTGQNWAKTGQNWA